MSTLTDRPDLRQLRIQAKDLIGLVRAADPQAIARVVSFVNAGSEFTLANAQLVIARENGYSSWPRMKRELDQTPTQAPKSVVTLFFEALASRDNEVVIAFLASNPELAGSSKRTEYGWSTPLHIAAKMGNLGAVRALVEAGAEVYAVNQSDYPPVFEAIYGKHEEVVNFLFEASAASDHGHPPTYGCGIDIVLAARLGLADRVRMHVEHDPLAVFRRGCIGEGVLHWPAHNGHVEIVSFLLDHGAPIEGDAIGLYGGKPLHWASEHAAKCVKLLLDRGANPNARNLQTNEFEGFTPLHMMATQREECIECARYLLAAGADPTLKDSRGRSPLAVAVESNRMVSAEFLKNLESVT